MGFKKKVNKIQQKILNFKLRNKSFKIIQKLQIKLDKLETIENQKNESST